eukprot:1802007-Rhodomonas_salina.2
MVAQDGNELPVDEEEFYWHEGLSMRMELDMGGGLGLESGPRLPVDSYWGKCREGGSGILSPEISTKSGMEGRVKFWRGDDLLGTTLRYHATRLLRKAWY